MEVIAIEKLHLMKTVHCDVKPANIIYNKETKRLALVDFGLSIQLDSKEELEPLQFSGYY